MTLNTFFQNYNASGEQRLVEDLILESIKIYGVETYYMPRTLVNQDRLFTEDAISIFDDAYVLEMYVKNVEGFEGEGEFLSRFGIEIRDQITLTISQRRYLEEVTDQNSAFTRPREGDLIYLPWIQSALENSTGALFEIKFVEHESVFYQLGELYTYDIVIERFMYSDERIDTGVADIDQIEEDYSVAYNLGEGLLQTESGYELQAEHRSWTETLLIEQFREDIKLDSRDDSQFFQEQSDDFVDFSEINPFSEGNL